MKNTNVIITINGVDHIISVREATKLVTQLKKLLAVND